MHPNEKVVQVVKIPGHMVPLFTIHYCVRVPPARKFDMQKWEIKRLIKKYFSLGTSEQQLH
jgi:hypothetical protein